MGMRGTTAIAVAMAILGLSVATAQADNVPRGSVQLSANEVKAKFIGHKWSNGLGTFWFKRNGRAYYDSPRRGRLGPFSYTVRADGVVHSAFTDFTFYEKPNGRLIYYHSKSGKYYPARP